MRCAHHGHERLVSTLANQRERIAERGARTLRAQHVAHRARVRTPRAVDEKRMRREAAREVQVVHGQHDQPALFAAAFAQQAEHGNLLMQIEVSDGLVDRIDEFLGRPDYDPHGAPIPQADGTMRGDIENAMPLSDCKAGARVRLSRVLTQSPDFLRHLAGAGLTLGVEVDVVETSPIGGTITLRTGGRKTQTLGHTAAAQLLATPVGGRA